MAVQLRGDVVLADAGRGDVPRVRSDQYRLGGMSQEQHKAECLHRWQALEQEARNQWRQYRTKRITRQQLERWLKQQSKMDERTIRQMFNAMRG